MNTRHYREPHLRGRLIYAARNRHEPEEPDEKHGKGQRPYAAQ